jgi:hypothetical protein
MADTPEMQVQLVSSHGMLVILEVLEGKRSRDVVMKLLQIINLASCLLRRCCEPVSSSNFIQLVAADLGFLESFCLIGYA